MKGAENRRRTRIVDKRFQYGIAIRLVLVLTAMLAAGIILAFAPSLYVLATTNDLKALEPAATEFLTLHERLWPAMLLSFAGIFIYSIFFSHRIAGPVYRINTILRDLLEGRNPGSLQVRDGDYLQETASLLQRLAKKIDASRQSSPASPDDSVPPSKPEGT